MMRWYVVQTKPKKEEPVQKQLARAGYELFIPQMKTLLSQKPLFPSYLFLKANFESSMTHRFICFTRGVRKILSNQEGPIPLDESIVTLLREKTLNGSLIEQSLLYKEGDSVRVKKGILTDLIGIIEKNIPEKGRIRILFKWFNQSMRATLKYSELEKAA